MKNNQREKVFPFFKKNKDIVFLDSGVTSLKPDSVIKEITNFYEKYSFSMGRSRNRLNQNVYKLYEEANKKVSKFINSKTNEIIYTAGTTDGINKLANNLLKNLKKGDEIILGKFEHASNYLPWLKIAKELNIKIVFYELNNNLTIDLDHLKKIVNNKTKLISITHKYNIFGSINNIKKIREVIGEKIILVVDGAQSVGQIKIDVKEMGCDFFVFGGHKMFGPFGIGVIYGKKELLEKMTPFQLGGGMNLFYDEEIVEYKPFPNNFLAGTINISGIIGIGAAIDFINEIGIEKIKNHNIELKKYLEEEISKINKIKIINKGIETSILYFEVEDTFADNISQYLEDRNIFVRPGASCVKIENNLYKQFRAIRISLHIYNNKEDIDKTIVELKKIKDFSKLKFDRNRYKNINLCE